MARKGKDLFVLLGERRNPAGQGGSQGKGRRKVGGAGGWFRSLFQAVSGPASTTSPRVGKSRSGTGRKHTPRVPRSLLVPGWFVILLLLLGVTAGFVAGRWSADRHGDSLDARLPNAPRTDGVEPVRFPDGRSPGQPDPQLQAGYLPPEKQEEQVAMFFFMTLDYPPSQRDRAEALARYLRGQGLETARIRRLPLENGSFRWLTLCYVRDAAEGKYSAAHAEECYARLQQVPPPRFEPRLAAAVQRLEGAHHLYSCKPQR